MIKDFFGIYSPKYEFEFNDAAAGLTLLNVALIILGWKFAPVIGIVNCVASIWKNTPASAHINFYIMQVAFIILNIYFLL